MVTLGNNESTSGHVDTSARHLFTAIKKSDYKHIEKLVKTNRNKGLLNAKDKDGNTFIHLVANNLSKFLKLQVLVLERWHDNIPDIDDSAPLIQDVAFNYHILYQRSFVCNNIK